MNHSSFFRFRPSRSSRHAGFSNHSGQTGAESGAPVPEPAAPEATHALRGILRPGSAGLIQRMCKSCEEEEVQRKPRPGADAAPASPAGAPALDGGLRRDISASGSAGRPLPGPLRRGFEERFGSDLGGVRTVTGDAAARLSDSLGARAFTVGDHIWFGRGEYRPESPDGQRLLAHEITHTLQQGGGTQGAGAQAPQASLRLGSSSDPAEAEADRVADDVMKGGDPGAARP